MGAREEVLVVPRDALFAGTEWAGFRDTDLAELLTRVRASYRFRPRREVEEDPSEPQPGSAASAISRTFRQKRARPVAKFREGSSFGMSVQRQNGKAAAKEHLQISQIFTDRQKMNWHAVGLNSQNLCESA